MVICTRCRAEYEDNRMCLCIVFGCCECQGRVCLSCCIHSAPSRRHGTTFDPEGYYICRRCARRYTRFCSCCPNRCEDRCGNCCARFEHVCCGGRERVRFIAPGPYPMFVTPPLIPSKGQPYSVNRDEALKILTKQVKINPKYLTNNRFSRFASTEIEVCQIEDAKSLNKAIASWGCAVVHDGSVGSGPNGQGFEINTTPACGNALPELLEEVCTALLTGKAAVNHSCGLHVHVDCRDYGYQEIQRFITYYSVLEPVLFAALHSNRASNTYCTPCGNAYYDRVIKGVKPDTKSLKNMVIPAVYGPQALDRLTNQFADNRRVAFHHFRQDHYGRTLDGGRNPNRYSAVNLHSYFLRGTVEFRMHHAAVDFVEVYGWTKLLVALMDAISKVSDWRTKQILMVSDAEIAGVKDLYAVEGSAEISKGLVVLSSLLPIKYVEHLVSKISLAKHVQERYREFLPAQLFYAHRHKTSSGRKLAIEKSGLTKL